MKVITRREMIKATGLIGLGLIYTRPFVETIHAKSAFEGYDGGDFAGLTPGFWKQKQHFGSWTGYEPEGLNASRYNGVFGVNTFDKDLTLLEALNPKGQKTPEENLARHAVAAILNAANPNINYPYTELEVIALVQGAYDNGNVEEIKDILDAYNNLEMPDD